jgi:hypothetical protein
MHPPEIRAEILRLVEEGLNDCEVSRRTGVPRATVRDMRRPRYVRKIPAAQCPRCWRAGRRIAFEPAAYAEMLGLYLGDGHISEYARADRLRIFLDSKYPRIVNETETLMRSFFPDNRVGRQPSYGGRMTILWVYSGHLRCLFPQHGPGRKHLRFINLEPWQEEIAGTEPWRLLKGLIRSDGCSFINRTGRYEYLSYGFCNASEGVVRIFVNACEQLRFRHRVTFDERKRMWFVRINRREDVAALVERIGTKM